jgi:hypothetical protein
MNDADCTIFECPKCQSRRAGVVASVPHRPNVLIVFVGGDFA